MTAAASSLTAILQRLQRFGDARIVQPTRSNDQSDRGNSTMIDQTDRAKRKRNQDGRLTFGVTKPAATKALPSVRMSFLTEQANEVSAYQTTQSHPKMTKASSISRSVYFTCNGDPTGRKAKYLRITPNRYMSWNDLLNDLTAKLKHGGYNLPHGVRQIFTPKHGHRIASLEDLQDGELYLCAGVEPFKPSQFKSSDSVQQIKEQSANPQQSSQVHTSGTKQMLPALNTVNLTASDSNIHLSQPSRYTRIPGVRKLNVSLPVPLRNKYESRFHRMYKRYHRLPAIKEQRELERDTQSGLDRNADHRKSNRNVANASVALFLRDELRKQGDTEPAESNAVHPTAAVYHQKKREFLQNTPSVPIPVAKLQGIDVGKPVLPPLQHPLANEGGRLINVIYYERASSNCKVVKILLNAPKVQPLEGESKFSDKVDEAYSRYQRLCSLKRIRKILNRTFSKDAAIKQKISGNSSLHLVTPSGREVVNTPDFLQILDTETEETLNEEPVRKKSVGAAISENNFVFIAVHDVPVAKNLGDVRGPIESPQVANQPTDTTTLSNNDLELILQELISKNANKRLVHKLYQALHHKETQPTAESLTVVHGSLNQTPIGNRPNETPTEKQEKQQNQPSSQATQSFGQHPTAAGPVAAIAKSEKEQLVVAVEPRVAEQPAAAEPQSPDTSRKLEKRVKFAEAAAAAEQAITVSELKESPLRLSRRLAKKSQAAKNTEADGVDSPTKSVKEDVADTNASSGEESKPAPPYDSEAEKRLFEADRRRRSQQITLVRRTLPPAPAFQNPQASASPPPAPTKNATNQAPLPPIRPAANDSDNAHNAAADTTAEKRPISGPVKSMLSIDTPRDTQIDMKALKTSQKDVHESDAAKAKAPAEAEKAMPKEKLKVSESENDKKQLKASGRPSDEAGEQDNKVMQPVLKATPRESAPDPKLVSPPQPKPAQAAQAQQVNPSAQKEKEDQAKVTVTSTATMPILKSRYSFTKFIRGVDQLQDYYDLGRQLGDGNFAIVREGRSRMTSKECAIKIIDKAKLKNKEYMLENEIRVLKTCSHPNIIELKDQFESEHNVFLVMELAKGGDLFDYITANVRFSEARAFEIVSDMSEAIYYLHSRNVVHRDLKPENLLICDGKDGRKVTKLGDFGLSMEVRRPIFTVCGTPTYVAPEILMERGYGLEVDLWALGVITYILLCGFPPFRSPERRQSDLFRMIKKGDFDFTSPYWDPISSSAKDLIRHLLVVDPSRRYKAVDVLTHPWILSRGNAKKLDRAAVTDLQAKTRQALEQKSALLLREYRETMNQLEQQFNPINTAPSRQPA